MKTRNELTSNLNKHPHLIEPERRVLKVALKAPFRRCFDYLPPIEQNIITSHSIHSTNPIPSPLILPGMRVRVPFGKSERIGMVVEIAEHSEFELDKLKNIHEILDPQPLFSESLLKLIHWASDYYHCPLGEVFERALPTWLRKGNIIEHPSKQYHDKVFEEKALKKILNQEQEHAVTAICKKFGQYQTFLLDGITGSGKTEVYLQVIEKTLEENKQALILVPEIGLAPQMLERFEARFNVPIALLHSSVSEKKRYIAWNMARTGEAPIVIGTRSAAFIPLYQPGIFIIDEEHDPSFKQQEGFRYHARDLIIMRASIEQVPVVLGTATPSLESLQNADLGRYKPLRLSQRAGDAKPPMVQILDIRHKKLDEGLSAQLIQEIKQTIDKNEQVLLFLNRRGFAPVLMCFDCGYVSPCQHCDARLTLHYQPKRLRCHHCDASLPVYTHCPQCQSTQLHPLGVGTERLEAALMQHFSNHSLVRIDKDTTRRKGTLEQAVEQVRSGQAHILFGTQMIAKGHHFPNVTLVAILDIDNALFSSDFRSTERLGQLLTQVAGRAGRASKLGTCLLQTCHPEHPLLKILLNQGYRAFAEHILSERKMANLPPFSYQALIRSDAKTNQEAFLFLQSLKKEILSLKHPSIELFGPVTAPMEKRAGRFHAQLLLQSKERSAIKRIMKTVMETVENLNSGNKIRWSLDIDPQEML